MKMRESNFPNYEAIKKDTVFDNVKKRVCLTCPNRRPTKMIELREEKIDTISVSVICRAVVCVSLKRNTSDWTDLILASLQKLR